MLSRLKIYTMFPLERLSDYVNIPLYQADFQRNRFCDDQIFVVKRILEEQWRKGLTTYVLALDLKQAFDQVLLKNLAEILDYYGVPHHFINLLITTCLTEETLIQH